MAGAPGHLLGQYIGNALEAAIEPLLRELARKHDLYEYDSDHCARCGMPKGGWRQ